MADALQKLIELRQAKKPIPLGEAFATSGINELNSTLRELQQTISDTASDLSEDKIKKMLVSIQSRIELAIQAIPTPKELDLSSITDALSQVQEAIKPVDFTDVMIGQQMLAREVADIQFPQIPTFPDFSSDLDEIKQRLTELEKPREYSFDIERFTSNPNSNIKKVTAKQVV